MKAQFKHEVIDGVLLLTDLSKPTMLCEETSITDDIEAVVEYCARELGLLPNQPLIYRDMYKVWDQIEHEDGKFKSFKLLKGSHGTLNKEEALLLVRDPRYDSMSDVWKLRRMEEQRKRAEKRAKGQAALASAGVQFTVKNDGAHLIIGHPGIINFWPGTSRWVHARNSSINGRGVHTLLDWLRSNHLLTKGN